MNAINVPDSSKNKTRDEFSGIENTIYLIIGAPVRLTYNFFIAGGLFNSAKGIVEDIIYGTHQSQQPPNLPLFVMVRFEKLNIKGFDNDDGLVPIPPLL